MTFISCAKTLEEYNEKKKCPYLLTLPCPYLLTLPTYISKHIQDCRYSSNSVNIILKYIFYTGYFSIRLFYLTLLENSIRSCHDFLTILNKFLCHDIASRLNIISSTRSSLTSLTSLFSVVSVVCVVCEVLVDNKNKEEGDPS